MPSKSFMLDDDIEATIYKRKGSRNLRLTVAHGGQVRITIPAWAPYYTGIDFAKSRLGWIRSQQVKPGLLVDGQAIGKAHRLELIAGSVEKPTSRLKSTVVTVRYPASMSPEAPAVQAAAEKGSIKALRAQAEHLLPQRLRHLAHAHGFEHNTISIKRLKGRWGSCDQHKNIVLNLFLMQLPWDLIDYVLIHELVHTEVMRHGPDFWQAMEKVQPGAKAKRKSLREHRPALNGIS